VRARVLRHRPDAVRLRLAVRPREGPGYIRATIENIESLGLGDEDKRRLYEGNARSVLGI
jgi:hypothetical protein